MGSFKKTKVCAIVSVNAAVLMFAILGIISLSVPIFEYTIPVINLTLSRWWDILFVAVYVGLNTNFCFLLDRLKKSALSVAGAILCGIFLAGGIIIGFTDGFGIVLIVEGAIVLIIGTGIIFTAGIIKMHKFLLKD